METTTLYIDTDEEISEKAEAIFESLGLDMDQAISIFLKQTVLHNGIPFDFPPEPKPEKVPITSIMGCLRGQIKISDDFDEPLEDFKDYM